MNFTLLHLLMLRCGIHVIVLKTTTITWKGRETSKEKRRENPFLLTFKSINRQDGPTSLARLFLLRREPFDNQNVAGLRLKIGKMTTRLGIDVFFSIVFVLRQIQRRKKIFDLSRYQLRLEFIIFFSPKCHSISLTPGGDSIVTKPDPRWLAGVFLRREPKPT